MGRRVPDEDIIPSIGKEKGILITKDINIHRTRLQYDLCQEHNLGIFFISMPKGMDKHWKIVKSLINHWEDIIRIIEKEKLPFAYRIKPKGKMEKL